MFLCPKPEHPRSSPSMAGYSLNSSLSQPSQQKDEIYQQVSNKISKRIEFWVLDLDELTLVLEVVFKKGTWLLLRRVREKGLYDCWEDRKENELEGE